MGGVYNGLRHDGLWRAYYVKQKYEYFAYRAIRMQTNAPMLTLSDIQFIPFSAPQSAEAAPHVVEAAPHLHEVQLMRLLTLRRWHKVRLLWPLVRLATSEVEHIHA